MMKMKKRVLFFATAMVLCTSLFARGGSQAGGENAAASDDPRALSARLTMYTSEPEDLAQEMINDFNRSYPNVRIDLFRSGTCVVTSKIAAELETGSTEANMLWFADIGYMKQLDERGLILHYSPEAERQINPEYSYNNGMGHEVRLIYNVIAYNTARVRNNPPRDWMDLTAPAFRSRVATADPNYSGGAFTALVVHIQNDDKVGWKFYDGMMANDVKMEQSNGNLQTKVSSGEYDAVWMVDFMALNAKREGSPVEVVWPASGAVLVPTPVALVNNLSPDQERAARAFVDHMFKASSQELFSRQGYIPVVPGMPLPPGAPAPDRIRTMPFDLEYYLRESSNIRNTYQSKFGN